MVVAHPPFFITVSVYSSADKSEAAFVTSSFVADSGSPSSVNATRL